MGLSDDFSNADACDIKCYSYRRYAEATSRLEILDPRSNSWIPYPELDADLDMNEDCDETGSYGFDCRIIEEIRDTCSTPPI